MIAICPGSYDPITNGHLDVISRAAKLFSEVIVAVGENSTKRYLFDLPDRLELVQQVTEHLPGVRAMSFTGLLVDFARSQGAAVLVKGIRFPSDAEFELQMAQINSVVGSVETVMLPAAPSWATLSSTMVREVAAFGGDVSAFVPPVVAERIGKKSNLGGKDGNG